MVKKINRTIIIVIGFVSILVIGNQIALRQYQISSERLLLEYHEMHALQEFKLSLKKFQTYYLESKDFNHDLLLDSLFLRIEVMKSNCEVFVTERHLGENWNKILASYETLKSINYRIFTSSDYDLAKESISQIQVGLDNMIFETKDEIIRTEERNNTLHKHSTITLLTAGIIIIVIISILSLSTARGITMPIKEFLLTFKKLGSGQRGVRAQIKGDDEFGQLAYEFNNLFDQLDMTTVTMEYFKNILNSIDGILIVTDKSGKIISSNKTVVGFLGYEESELENTQILELFESHDEEKVIDYIHSDGEKLIERLNKSESIWDKSGNNIPVLTTCTSYKTNENDFLIVVVHDISEKIEYQRQLKEAKRRALVAINEAQEAERARIATELHDSLGQKLSAVFYALQEIYNSTDDSSKIEEIQRIVNDSIAETRSISHSLMPGVLKDFGLCAALNELITSTNKLQKISFKVKFFDFEDRAEPTIEKVLFRICQEALNNILKHSRASKATFQVFKSPGLITLMIEDDGIGFDPDAHDVKMHEGIGLLSMRERIESYNGLFTINSSPENGTELIVEIPYKS